MVANKAIVKKPGARPAFERMRGPLLAFGFGCLAAALFVLPWTFIPEVFYIGSDYVHQSVPFWTAANRAIKEGLLLWNNTLDLGVPFTVGYSYYSIGSPFFWLSMLVRPEAFYRLAPWLLIVKCGTSALTSFCWLRRATRTEYAALVGSLLYAFCGFQISNLNFFAFADVMALFPLLLITLDAAVLHGKKRWFALAVAVNALCNWFCFFGQALFLALYFVVKLWCGDYPRLRLRVFGRLAAESLLGVAVAAFIWVPSVISVGASPRAALSFESVRQALIIKPIYLADLVRGLLMPPECGFSRAFFMEGLFNGGELYLPLFGMVLVIAYMWNRRRSFETWLLLVCLVCMLVPVLNSAFVAFNAEYYTRWFYMPSLIAALASAKVLEDKEMPIRAGIIGYGALWGIFGLIGLWFILYFQVPFIYNMAAAAVYIAISLAGLAATLLWRRLQNRRPIAPLLLAGVVAFSSVCGLYNIYRMHKCWSPEAPARLYTAPETLQLPADDSQYRRIDADGYHFFNLGTMVGEPSMDSFTSTISPAGFAFYDAIGVPRSVISDIPSTYYGYRAFLSARYWVRYGAGANDGGVPGWQSLGVQGDYHIFENQYYIPPGFTYEYYLTRTLFEALPAEAKHLAVVRALVVEDADEAAVAQYLAPLPQSEYNFTHAGFAQDVADRRQTAAGYSAATRDGYLFHITLPRENIVFLSVPNDPGWQVQVNGAPAEVIAVTGGLMGVTCPAGEVEIALHYTAPGQPPALVAGGAAVVIWLGWLGWDTLAKRRRTQTAERPQSQSGGPR